MICINYHFHWCCHYRNFLMHSVHCQEWQNWYLGFAAFLFLLLVRLHSFSHLSQIFQLRNFVVLQLHQEEALIAYFYSVGKFYFLLKSIVLATLFFQILLFLLITYLVIFCTLQALTFLPVSVFFLLQILIYQPYLKSRIHHHLKVLIDRYNFISSMDKIRKGLQIGR